MAPPNIIKLSHTIWKLQAAQDFSFRGDYHTKKVGVVSLVRDMPTGPPLHLNQILSDYLKHYGNYNLHQILASWEIIT